MEVGFYVLLFVLLALFAQLCREWWALPRTLLRASFWAFGLLLALVQAWVFRYYASADAISYLDMSDGVVPGQDWHRLINGVWSPLYPFLLGMFRNIFGISPSNEIVAANILNVVFFAFAFICFELLIANLLEKNHAWIAAKTVSNALPVRACIALLYSMFLWASLNVITLTNLRPDMLMSGFLYLAAAKLVALCGERGTWNEYLVLGSVLGIGFLAKAPMLPLGILILVVSIFVVQKHVSGFARAATSLAVVLAIGSLYFIPLSLSRGRFTLGESGAYNYLVHVDRAGPGQGWYLENPGQGIGRFQAPPMQISQTPPVYAFGADALITHPLRFDPAVWMKGVRPRLALKRQIGEAYLNLANLGKPLRQMLPVLMVALLLMFRIPKREAQQGLMRTWPLALLAIAGCAMYAVVHLEGRYIGAFLVLFVCSIIAGTLEVRNGNIFNRIFFTTTLALASFSLLLTPVSTTYWEYSRTGKGTDEAAIAAAELHRLGIQSGDRIGRISSKVSDLAMDRIARVEVAAEVDYLYVEQFWLAPVEQQQSVLQLLAEHGVKAVIATHPVLTGANQRQWKQLASTDFWVWLPQRKSN